LRREKKVSDPEWEREGRFGERGRERGIGFEEDGEDGRDEKG
jgi:hypothetical protein